MIFAPGLSFSASFEVYGAEKVTAFIDGDLAEYATISDPNPDGGTRVITVELTLPQTLSPPGGHVLGVNAREVPPNEGMVGGVAVAKRLINVVALYPDPLLSIEGFGIESVAINSSSATASFRVQSLTAHDLVAVYADIDLTTENGTVLSTTRTEYKTVPSGGSQTFTAELPTSKLLTGPYRGLATVHYASNTTAASTTFQIGTLDFSLVSYPPNLTVNTTNKFLFDVRSNWVESVKSVSAIVTIGDVTDTSADVDFAPFGTTQMKAYIETQDLPLGPAEGMITLQYAGGMKAFPITVTIVPVVIPETVPEPGFFARMNDSFKKNPVVFLYAGLVLLVLIVVFLLFFWRRKSGPAQATAEPVARR